MRNRIVKIYFRNQKKVMVAIPNIEGLVSDDVLITLFRRMDDGGLERIYRVDEDEVSSL